MKKWNWKKWVRFMPKNKCSMCYGRGVVYVGDRHEYTIEPCECKA